jgi:hypothetical protein
MIDLSDLEGRGICQRTKFSERPVRQADARFFGMVGLIDGTIRDVPDKILILLS